MRIGPTIFALAAAPVVFAGYSTRDGPNLAARTFVEPSWELEITPGGETATVIGTVQEAVAQMVELNPDWKEQFNMTDAGVEKRALELRANADRKRESPRDFTTWERSPLVKRTDWEHDRDGSHGYCCSCDRWKEVALVDVASGIYYLNRVGGKPSLGAGPGRCSRVSCSSNAGISWCNDNRSTKTLDSFKSIAQGADFLLDHCNTRSKNRMRGQVFHKTNWNVYVTKENC